MRKKLKFLLIPLLLGAALLLWQRWKQDSAPAVLYGNVEIRQVDVAFRVGGRIAALLVDEGDSVDTGAELARLDEDMLRHEDGRARAEYARQLASLQRLESGYRSEEIAAARAEVLAAAALAENARLQLRRVEGLRAGNAVSQKELDSARGSYRNAAARQLAAEEQLALVSTGYREEDIAAQRAAVDAARAEQELAAIRLRDARLLAPQKGIVLTRAEEAGAIVQAGQTVFTLSLVDPVWLRVYVDETRLGSLRPGMTVRVECDAAPGRGFPGTVGFISPSAEFTPKNVETEEVRSSLVYRVRVRMADPENIMRQGMPVRVFLVDSPDTPDASEASAS